MEKSNKLFKTLAGAAIVFCASSSVFAQAEMNSSYRKPVGDNYKKSWKIFGETDNDGLLTKNDTYVQSAGNWFTSAGAEDHSSYVDKVATGKTWEEGKTPHFVQTFDPKDNYWINTEKKNRITLFTTYSQMDNNSKLDHDRLYYYDDAERKMMNEQTADRNGWALGWIAGGNDLDPNSTSEKTGQMNMDIYVKDGQFNGVNRELYGNTNNYQNSNPKVVASNGIAPPSTDPNPDRTVKPRFVLNYDQDRQAYSADANEYRKQWYAKYGKENEFELDTILESMKFQEKDANKKDWSMTNGTGHAGADLVNQDGTLVYEDAFNAQNEWYNDAATGGTVGGLGGKDEQVVRIDLGDFNEEGLEGIDEVAFLDFTSFAYKPNDSSVSTVHPDEILFLVDRSRTWEEGQLYYDANGNGQHDEGEAYFAENRLYLALEAPEDTPEPATMLLLTAGGIGFLARRKRKAAK